MPCTQALGPIALQVRLVLADADCAWMCISTTFPLMYVLASACTSMWQETVALGVLRCELVAQCAADGTANAPCSEVLSCHMHACQDVWQEVGAAKRAGSC